MARVPASALGGLLLAVLLLATAGCATHAPSLQGDARADRIAREWLALVDNGAYERSWQRASTLFQNSIAQDAWVEAVRSARVGTAAPQRRELVSTAHTRKLPGVPENDYVVLVYASRFDDRRPMQETVTLVREDEDLKTAGYFLR